MLDKPQKNHITQVMSCFHLTSFVSSRGSENARGFEKLPPALSDHDLVRILDWGIDGNLILRKSQ